MKWVVLMVVCQMATFALCSEVAAPGEGTEMNFFFAGLIPDKDDCGCGGDSEDVKRLIEEKLGEEIRRPNFMNKLQNCLLESDADLCSSLFKPSVELRKDSGADTLHPYLACSYAFRREFETVDYTDIKVLQSFHTTNHAFEMWQMTYQVNGVDSLQGQIFTRDLVLNIEYSDNNKGDISSIRMVDTDSYSNKQHLEVVRNTEQELPYDMDTVMNTCQVSLCDNPCLDPQSSLCDFCSSTSAARLYSRTLQSSTFLF